MFSRFTEKAIQAIMLAQEEAKKFHHSYVGTEHIVFGILGEGDNVVIKTMKEMGFTPEAIRAALEERLEFGGSTSEYGNIPFTQQAKQVLTNAWDEARKLGHNYVNVEHLFLSIFRDPSSIATRVLTEMGISIQAFKEGLFKQLGNKVAFENQQKAEIPTPTLDLFGRDLTWLAKEGKLDPVIGREKEIERIIQILCRRTKNNPVLTGEPGVGKTAIIEGLAQRIIKRELPEKLQSKRVITLDLGLLVAGTKYRGEFEDRVKKVMEEVRKAENVILFIDELHTIIGTGGSEGSLDAANLFKPALARGELQCIGATTLDEYRKHIEGDGALERRFQSVIIEEPSQQDTFLILKGIKKRYEDFHKVTITESALHTAVEMSSRYITERFLPDKAVDLVDEAAAKVMLKSSGLSGESKALQVEFEAMFKDLETAQLQNDKDMVDLLEKRIELTQKKLKDLPQDEQAYISRTVTPHMIAEVVAMATGIPVIQVTQEESEQLLRLEADLTSRIKGQPEAISALTRAVKRSKMGLKDPKRPSGSFLFLGPTGVGKSELAKTLAKQLFGSEDAMVRIDMSEYMEKHTVSRLVGSPPGYVGYNEGGQLSEPVRRKPYCLVLLDEIEKASPDVLNVLLQVLDDGKLTDASGRVVNFKNTIIVMTSNIGSQFIERETSFGFMSNAEQEGKTYESLKVKLMDELRRAFKPEFINRIDDIVVFKSLTKETIRTIINIMVNDLEERLLERNIRIKLSEDVKDFLADKGFDQKNGARPLKRALQEHFEDQLADHLLKRGTRSDVSVSATMNKGKIQFSIRTIKPSLKPLSTLSEGPSSNRQKSGSPKLISSAQA